MLEDKLLLWKFKHGSRDAFRAIYEKYAADMLTLAGNLLDDKVGAEDIVQDVFIKLVESVETFRLTGSLKSYLTTCVVNHARSVYRARQRKKTVGLDEAGQVKSDSNGPQQSAIFNEEYQRLQDAMAELPYQQQEIIILHLQNSMGFRQIAKLQNIPINTAKSRYRYALEKLRSLLDDEVTK